MEAETSQLIVGAAYLFCGFLFWQIVVRGGLRMGAEEGDSGDVAMLQEDDALPAHMILVKSLVVCLWPGFLVFGIASRYADPETAAERN